MSSEQIVRNRILRQLPAGELEALQPWLTPFALVQGEILHESGTEVASVYFPTDGMVSLLAITEAGEAIETGIVGADGLVGGGVTLNGHLFGQAIVQIEGSALKIQKDQFVEAYNTHQTLRNLVNRFQAICWSRPGNARCAMLSIRSTAACVAGCCSRRT